MATSAGSAKPGQSAVEIAVLLAVVAGALALFFGFIRSAVSGRLKVGADSFGQGLLYGPPQEGCWSCAVQDYYADEARCFRGFNPCVGRVVDLIRDGICACCPAPPSCWSCVSTSGYGMTYATREAACAAATAALGTDSCPHRGKPYAGRGSCTCTMSGSLPCTEG